jgi:hypothetical protein
LREGFVNKSKTSSTRVYYGAVIGTVVDRTGHYQVI